jgi:hypothetical protein
MTTIFNVLFVLPVMPKESFSWMVVAAGYALVSTISDTAFIRLAWKLVGGKTSINRIFVFINYINSTSIIILLPVALPFGKMAVSLAHKANADGFDWAKWSENDITNLITVFFMLIVGYTISLVWSIFTWGAYRRANKLSRWKSLLAFSTAFVLAVPVHALLATAMSNVA